jgi:MFS family permease
LSGSPPADGAAGPTRPGRRRVSGAVVFRHRDFQLYFFGKLLALLALYMLMVAITYQVYDLTGDPLDLAYIGLAIFAPAIGFALITGYVSDRFDRRLVLALCYGVMLLTAILFLVFTLSGWGEVWPVFLILVVLGTGRAFYQPASNALLPNLVPTEEFPNAVAWNTTSNKTAQVCGPALGGLLYLLGPEVVYAGAAATFAAGTAMTAMIRTRSQREGREPTNLRTLLAGVRYVWEKKIILGAITMDLFVVLMGGVTALLPIYAKDILEVGPSGAGLLRSAMAAGGMVAALALTQIPMRRAVGRILYVSVAIYGLATIVFGYSEWFVLSLIAMATLGGADMVSVYIRSTLLQIATPDDMRGRVSAVNGVFVGASNELGEFRAGLMAAWLGAVPAVVIGGIGSVILCAACWPLFPDLRRVQRMDRHMYAAPREPGSDNARNRAAVDAAR